MKKNEKAITQIIILGLITFIISAMGLKFNAFFILSILISPVPIAILTLKYKEK
jgi:hypothetical protein